MKKRKWTTLFAVCLIGYTAYALLDTFVFERTYQSEASYMNYALFEAEAQTVGDDTADTEKNSLSEENDGTEAADAPEMTERGQTEGHRKRPGSGGHAAPGSDSRNADSSDTAAAGNVSSAENGQDSGTVTAESISDEMTYEDENVSITLREYTVNDTAVYAADVSLSSAQYLKTAFADDTYGRNVADETSDIAEACNAVLAVNGDYYGAQESGYVIRNGVIYRDTPSDAELLCIYADGTMKIADPSEVTAQELLDEGVWQAFSFGPALVTDGEISVSEDEETGKAMASNPRTAIGMIGPLHYLFVVADGRTNESEGLSLYELAAFMEQLGASTAYNLDGGGSSSMVFEGEVINNPTTTGNSIKERKVSDIVYIG